MIRKGFINPKLGKTSKRVLAAIDTLISQGTLPTIRAIQLSVGASSTSVVSSHIERLDKLGYLTFLRSEGKNGETYRYIVGTKQPTITPNVVESPRTNETAANGPMCQLPHKNAVVDTTASDKAFLEELASPPVLDKRISSGGIVVIDEPRATTANSKTIESLRDRLKAKRLAGI